MIGIRTTGIHAPIVNFDTTTTVSTMPVATAPTALTASFDRHRGSLERVVVDHHAGLREREPGEHAHRVERDQGRGLAAEHDDEQRRDAREDEHAVREHETVATVRELAREEAVPRDDRREPREVGVRGVGREDQDRERGELQHVVEDAPTRTRPCP